MVQAIQSATMIDYGDQIASDRTPASAASSNTAPTEAFDIAKLAPPVPRAKDTDTTPQKPDTAQDADRPEKPDTDRDAKPASSSEDDIIDAGLTALVAANVIAGKGVRATPVAANPEPTVVATPAAASVDQTSPAAAISTATTSETSVLLSTDEDTAEPVLVGSESQASIVAASQDATPATHPADAGADVSSITAVPGAHVARDAAFSADETAPSAQPVAAVPEVAPTPGTLADTAQASTAPASTVLAASTTPLPPATPSKTSVKTPVPVAPVAETVGDLVDTAPVEAASADTDERPSDIIAPVTPALDTSALAAASIATVQAPVATGPVAAPATADDASSPAISSAPLTDATVASPTAQATASATAENAPAPSLAQSAASTASPEPEPQNAIAAASVASAAATPVAPQAMAASPSVILTQGDLKPVNAEQAAKVQAADETVTLAPASPTAAAFPTLAPAATQPKSAQPAKNADLRDEAMIVLPESSELSELGAKLAAVLGDASAQDKDSQQGNDQGAFSLEPLAHVAAEPAKSETLDAPLVAAPAPLDTSAGARPTSSISVTSATTETLRMGDAVASEMRYRAMERQVLTALKQGADEVRLSLYPPALGQVVIRLSLDGQKVRVGLKTANADASDALSSGEDGLRAALETQGFSLAGFDISEQSAQERQNQQASVQAPYAVNSTSPRTTPTDAFSIELIA